TDLLQEHVLHEESLQANPVGFCLGVPDADDRLVLDQYPSAFVSLGQESANFTSVKVPLLGTRMVRGILGQLREVDRWSLEWWPRGLVPNPQRLFQVQALQPLEFVILHSSSSYAGDYTDCQSGTQRQVRRPNLIFRARTAPHSFRAASWP